MELYTGLLVGDVGSPQPDTNISEHDKFANNGEWFGKFARYIVYNFYNYKISNVLPNTGYDFSFSDDVLENFAYYFGEQRNKIFLYAAQLPSGNSIPAPFIAGQQIRNFVDNMMGNIDNISAPIGDSISAVNLDYDSILDKKVKYNIIRAAHKNSDALNQLAELGVGFSPTSKQYKSADEIDTDEENEIDKYQDAAVKITRSIYFSEDLENQFKTQDALHQFVGGVSATIIEPIDGQVKHEEVPSYNAIYDYRSKDSWGKDAMLGGAIKLMTPEELRAECDDITNEEYREISYMARNGGYEATAYRANFNAGYSNLRWWGADGRIAVAKVYFIVKRDLRTKRKENSLGQKSISFYDDKKNYQTNEVDEKGKQVHKLGKDIKGEDWAWDVATCYLIGNKWVKKYGYVDYVVRDSYGWPQLPIMFYSHNLVNGFSKSIVSRLRPLEAEYDRIMLKIREKMGRDYGKVFILNGQKMGITDAIDLLTDWKTSGVTVTAGDQNMIMKDGERLVEVVDGRLEDLNPYINALEVLRREMQQTVSISDYALGQQTDTVGKAVQAQSIANSTLGNIPLYKGLVTFLEKKLQYSFDLAKQFIKEGNYTVVISRGQVELLHVTKDLPSKMLGIYIKPNDSINGENKHFLKQLLFNMSQNAQVMESQGITLIDTLELLKATTYDSGIAKLKKTQESNKAKAMQAEQSNMEYQSKMEADMKEQMMLFQAALQQLKDDNANSRNTQDNITSLIEKKMDSMISMIQGGEPAKSPLGAKMEEQGGEQAGQEQQMAQQIGEALSQGADPNQIMQQLVQGGVPEEQAGQLIQSVMEQMQQT